MTLAPEPEAKLRAGDHVGEPDVEWLGSRAFRVLSARFELQWNTPELEAGFLQMYGDFAVPDDVWKQRRWPFGWDLVVYRLADHGPDAEDEQRFRLYRDQRIVVGARTAGSLLDRTGWEINHDVTLNARDWLLLHAGAVVAPNGAVVVLPAVSGGGKSSLVTALVAAGFGFLSDEFAPFDPVTRTLAPFPRAITLKPGSFSLFPELAAAGYPADATQWHVRPPELGGTYAAGGGTIDLVIAPTYRRDGAVRVEPLRRSETLLTLGSNCPNLVHYGRRGMQLLGEAVRRAEGYRLTYSDLDAAVATVRSLTESGAGAVLDTV